MSVIVIDPTARNLPEQVLKNTQNIAELQSAIDKLAEDLPDIMGRSPALYKEVVALTTPDAPTGSFNLDFSKTSYNVKNGDFVFAVFSNGATFNSYVGLLSVTNDTAGSGIYSASVLSVTPNLKGNKGDTGATGPQGQPGEPGKPALWCNTIITGSEPLAGGSCNLGSNYFSRTPENGEKFLALWQNTNDSNHPYFVNLQIASDTSPYTCNILYVSDIKGQPGEPGKPALWCNTINTNAVPYEGETASIGLGSFNRAPSAGENFIALWINTENNGHTYLVSMTVVGTASPYTCLITSVSDTKGPQGPQGPAGESEKLYKHTIYIAKSSQAPYAKVNIELYNRSATQFTYSSFMSYASGKRINASGVKYQDATHTAIEWVEIIANHIVAQLDDNTTFSLEEANVTFTDTVEEI